MIRYTTDKARPGLVGLYDIWPGNGVGQFLQPRSPHGVNGDGGNNLRYNTHQKLQSKYHRQQTNTGRMPFLSPNQQCQSTEGKSDVAYF